ncbi:hypothetical protein SAMN05444405_102185 [Bacteroides luti]|uniref:LTXXQ motif family protein n=1 Tax=Bacteroides luti TaxID=1297750 RepID=A0A1M4UWJ1_9BACE|nr:hypothetical protein [Bacteroides luti]SHE61055.1 hypothetical protein SAMN05444405_102185 [Bacteroides luti]
MKTKLFMTLAIVLMSVCSSLKAQEVKKERVFPNEKMIKELNLTDKQVAKLKEGDADLKSQMKALHEKEMQSKKEMKQSIKDLKAARKEMIRNSMSKDQYISYLEMQIDRLQKMNMKKNQKQFGFKGPRGSKHRFMHRNQAPQGAPNFENAPESDNK